MGTGGLTSTNIVIVFLKNFVCEPLNVSNLLFLAISVHTPPNLLRLYYTRLFNETASVKLMQNVHNCLASLHCIQRADRYT